MKEITKAILEVSKEVKNISKNMEVGAGAGKYKAVSDSDLRNKLREHMHKAGLIIVPCGVDATTTVERYQDDYGKNKQTVFTEAHTQYKLIHAESGESLELAGYGHGVDSQDKGAGKATTYALKNTLLDLFFITKGEECETDATHSDDIEVAPLDTKLATTRRR